MTRDITVDANLTNNTAPALADGLLLRDDGTGTLQEITPDNLLKAINLLTADSTPDRTADYVATWDNSASTAKKVLLGNVGYDKIYAGSSNSAPADNTTYYFGAWPHEALGTTGGVWRLYTPIPCTITKVDLYAAFTNGSNEASSIYLRKNNTTDTLLSNAVVMDSTPFHLLVTGLSIAMTETDYVEFKWTTPNPGWGTNPTAVYWWCQIITE